MGSEYHNLCLLLVLCLCLHLGIKKVWKCAYVIYEWIQRETELHYILVLATIQTIYQVPKATAAQCENLIDFISWGDVLIFLRIMCCQFLSFNDNCFDVSSSQTFKWDHNEALLQLRFKKVVKCNCFWILNS